MEYDTFGRVDAQGKKIRIDYDQVGWDVYKLVKRPHRNKVFNRKGKQKGCIEDERRKKGSSNSCPLNLAVQGDSTNPSSSSSSSASNVASSVDQRDNPGKGSTSTSSTQKGNKRSSKKGRGKGRD